MYWDHGFSWLNILVKKNFWEHALFWLRKILGHTLPQRGSAMWHVKESIDMDIIFLETFSVTKINKIK